MLLDNQRLSAKMNSIGPIHEALPLVSHNHLYKDICLPGPGGESLR